MPVPDKFKKGQYVRHVGTGGIYRIHATPSDNLRLEATAELAYLYGKKDDDVLNLWVRERGMMEDGRFELVENLGAAT